MEERLEDACRELVQCANCDARQAEKNGEVPLVLMLFGSFSPVHVGHISLLCSAAAGIHTVNNHDSIAHEYDTAGTVDRSDGSIPDSGHNTGNVSLIRDDMAKKKQRESREERETEHGTIETGKNQRSICNTHTSGILVFQKESFGLNILKGKRARVVAGIIGLSHPKALQRKFAGSAIYVEQEETKRRETRKHKKHKRGENKQKKARKWRKLEAEHEKETKSTGAKLYNENEHHNGHCEPHRINLARTVCKELGPLEYYCTCCGNSSISGSEKATNVRHRAPLFVFDQLATASKNYGAASFSRGVRAVIRRQTERAGLPEIKVITCCGADSIGYLKRAFGSGLVCVINRSPSGGTEADATEEAEKVSETPLARDQMDPKLQSELSVLGGPSSCNVLVIRERFPKNCSSSLVRSLWCSFSTFALSSSPKDILKAPPLDRTADTICKEKNNCPAASDGARLRNMIGAKALSYLSEHQLQYPQQSTTAHQPNANTKANPDKRKEMEKAQAQEEPVSALALVSQLAAWKTTSTLPVLSWTKDVTLKLKGVEASKNSTEEGSQTTLEQDKRQKSLACDKEKSKRSKSSGELKEERKRSGREEPELLYSRGVKVLGKGNQATIYEGRMIARAKAKTAAESAPTATEPQRNRSVAIKVAIFPSEQKQRGLSGFKKKRVRWRIGAAEREIIALDMFAHMGGHQNIVACTGYGSTSGIITDDCENRFSDSGAAHNRTENITPGGSTLESKREESENSHTLHPSASFIVLEKACCGLPEFLSRLPGDQYDPESLGPFPDMLHKKIILDLLQGLTFAAKAGIYHRDLNVNNIVVFAPSGEGSEPAVLRPYAYKKKRSKDGTCSLKEAALPLFKICDWGSSKRRGEEANVPRGSCRRYAPEALSNKQHYDTRCDVFMFGCLVYELYSRKQMWSELSTLEAIQMTLDNKRPKINKRHWDPVWRDAVLRCWDPWPERRPPFEEMLTFIKW